MKVILSVLTAGLLGIVAQTAAAADASALAQKGACMACHSVDKKILGPAFKDVAAKYKGLKVGGTIGSRFENELKLEVPLNHIPTIQKHLTDLANNPAAVEAAFGAGWTMTENFVFLIKIAQAIQTSGSR